MSWRKDRFSLRLADEILDLPWRVSARELGVELLRDLNQPQAYAACSTNTPSWPCPSSLAKSTHAWQAKVIYRKATHECVSIRFCAICKNTIQRRRRTCSLAAPNISSPSPFVHVRRGCGQWSYRYGLPDFGVRLRSKLHFRILGCGLSMSPPALRRWARPEQTLVT